MRALFVSLLLTGPVACPGGSGTEGGDPAAEATPGLDDGCPGGETSCIDGDVQGDVFDAVRSAIYDIVDGEVVVILSTATDFCQSFLTKASFDDGDICVDAAGHPTTLYLWGLPADGGVSAAADLRDHLIGTGVGSGCEWHGAAQEGTVTFDAEDLTGTLQLRYGSAWLTGSFSDLQRCPGLPNW